MRYLYFEGLFQNCQFSYKASKSQLGSFRRQLYNASKTSDCMFAANINFAVVILTFVLFTLEI